MISESAEKARKPQAPHATAMSPPPDWRGRRYRDGAIRFEHRADEGKPSPREIAATAMSLRQYDNASRIFDRVGGSHKAAQQVDGNWKNNG